MVSTPSCLVLELGESGLDLACTLSYFERLWCRLKGHSSHLTETSLVDGRPEDVFGLFTYFSQRGLSGSKLWEFLCGIT